MLELIIGIVLGIITLITAYISVELSEYPLFSIIFFAFTGLLSLIDLYVVKEFALLYFSALSDIIGIVYVGLIMSLSLIWFLLFIFFIDYVIGLYRAKK